MEKIPHIKIGQKATYTKFAQDVDFFELFQKIEQRVDTCFLFESLGEEGKFSRYSILGFEPAHIVSGTEKMLRVDGTDYAVKNPYFALRDIMPKQTLAKDYTGGLVGYLGYEAFQYFEPSLHIKDHKRFDRFMFGVYTDGLVFDKLTNELFYFYYDTDRSAVLEKVKGEIRAGNTFQCEVGFKTEYKLAGEAIGVYERLRAVNPSPFMYYLKFGTKKIVGASPELLFSLRDGEMTTRPLAGTIARGKSDEEDQKLARELLNDPKERAEHNMIVDLHRNDIGKVAQFGSVRI